MQCLLFCILLIIEEIILVVNLCSLLIRFRPYALCANRKSVIKGQSVVQWHNQPSVSVGIGEQLCPHVPCPLLPLLSSPPLTTPILYLSLSLFSPPSAPLPSQGSWGAYSTPLNPLLLPLPKNPIHALGRSGLNPRPFGGFCSKGLKGDSRPWSVVSVAYFCFAK